MTRGVRGTLRRLGLLRRWDQLLVALVTRWTSGASRERFILVTGFHHSGTTVMQAELHRRGVFTFLEDRGAGGGRPQELPLRHLHRIERAAHRASRSWFMTKWPSNSAGAARRLGLELRLLAPACTVVVCHRDPAATALSLSRRHGWDAAQARADAAMQECVLDAWRTFARRHRGPVHFVPLEAFSLRPESYVRRIVELAETPLPPAADEVPAGGRGSADPASEAGLPDPREHIARRRAQAALPVYPVDPDDWLTTQGGDVLAVLCEIRERHGASACEPEAATLSGQARDGGS